MSWILAVLFVLLAAPAHALSYRWHCADPDCGGLTPLEGEFTVTDDAFADGLALASEGELLGFHFLFGAPGFTTFTVDLIDLAHFFGGHNEFLTLTATGPVLTGIGGSFLLDDGTRFVSLMGAIFEQTANPFNAVEVQFNQVEVILNAGNFDNTPFIVQTLAGEWRVIPEPSTVLLLASGVLGLLWRSQKRSGGKQKSTSAPYTR